MKSLILAILAALLLAPVTSQPAYAQAETENDDLAPYMALFVAMQSGMDMDAAFENSIEALKDQYRAIPEMAADEEASPGFIDELVEATRPALLSISNRSLEAMKYEASLMLSGELTVAEANELADFYNSELGRKYMRLISENYRPVNTLADIESGGDVTREQVRADNRNAVSSAIAQMTPAEMYAIEQQLATMSGVSSLGTAMPKLVAIRTKYENLEPSAEEAAMIEKAVAEVMDRRFPIEE